MNIVLKYIHQVMMAMAAMVFSCASVAQSGKPYPSEKPLSIVVGLQAGTGSDIAVRAVADRLGSALKQSVVVENTPGAGGILAALRGVRASPDGYQLVALSSGAITVAPNLETTPPYDPLKDLVPVAMVAGIPSVFFVYSDHPARSMKEFLDIARKRPGQPTYASGGTGSVQHLAGEQLKTMAGVDLLHVPYKGSAQATQDVVGGRVDGGFQGLSTVLPYIEAGKLRALAAGGSSRATLMPDLETLHESGISGFHYEPWTAIFAPAGTSPEIIARLNKEIRRITNEPSFRDQWVKQGFSSLNQSPDEMRKLIDSEYKENREIIEKLNLRK